MQTRVKRWVQRGAGLLAIAAGVTGAVIALGTTGMLQTLEWTALDSFFRLRPQEPKDSRIVIVTIGERDLAEIGKWPLSDTVLADLITQLNRYQPKAIGLGLYRDVPVEPGHQLLQQVFATTPNLVGIEKFSEEHVAPPKMLAQRGQVGFADLVLDGDGRVRRGLLAVRTPEGQLRPGLATQLALTYLQSKGITPQILDPNSRTIQIGQAVFTPLRQWSGGYASIDNGGYQILLNYRGELERFKTVSLLSVLRNQISEDEIRDRIVLIGSTAVSADNFFYTPYDAEQTTPGIFVHANLASSMISAALGEKRLIRTFPEPLEWIWIFLGSVVGAVICQQLLQPHLPRRVPSSYFISVALLLSAAALYTAGLTAFINGWWVPIAAPSLGLLGTTMVSGLYYSHKLRELGCSDGLTQVANRRSFDHYLEQRLWERKDLSLILCDVDFFKAYNDCYGHQSGDRCLQQIAEAIRRAVRRRDLVARYGGEEFAIILPDTTAQTAFYIAERIQYQIRQLHIPHRGSKVYPYVTVSLGLASAPYSARLLPSDLIAAADQALYHAKLLGRNQIVVQSDFTHKGIVNQKSFL